MSDINVPGPLGVLGQGWSAMVGDYAIAGGWSQRGEALVVGDAGGSIYAFDGNSGATVWERPEVHDGGVLSMAIHPGGSMFATAGQDGRVLIWNAAEGEISRAIELGNDWVENVAWSPDGQRLAVSCSRQVHAYNADGEEVWRSENHPSTVSAIAWSSSKELATACYGRVSFFEAATGALRQKLEWQGSLVSMVLSSDGGIVVCGSQDNSVHFWRRSTGHDSEMWGYPGKPSALAFDATGTLLATGGGESVTVWSFRRKGPEGTKPGVLQFHVEPITTLAFAPGEMRLASGGRDGAVVVWSLQRNGKGGPIGAEDLGASVAEVYWRPDGGALAALDAQGGVTVWQIGQAKGRIRRPGPTPGPGADDY
ncbi:MAG: PQQ-binding-like beta-propeller repeat protein [Chloroflexota bacterium]|nr:PQQ-binding-like beta-propeller repeat protein [Chloroflexota bacterium]